MHRRTTSNVRAARICVLESSGFSAACPDLRVKPERVASNAVLLWGVLTLKEETMPAFKPSMIRVALVALAALVGTSPAIMANDSSKRPSQIDETFTAEEIAALEELVKSADRVYERVDTLHSVGSRGGEHENWALARCHLATARARLALAKGDKKEALNQRQIAVEAAKENVKAIEAAYDAGTATLDLVLAAHTDLADARIALSKLRRKVAADSGDSGKK
jgi:hypothetical protein